MSGEPTLDAAANQIELPPGGLGQCCLPHVHLGIGGRLKLGRLAASISRAHCSCERMGTALECMDEQREKFCRSI